MFFVNKVCLVFYDILLALPYMGVCSIGQCITETLTVVLNLFVCVCFLL